MMFSDAMLGSDLAKKISLTLPVQTDFSLFAVGFLSPLDEEQQHCPHKGFLPVVSQGL